MRTNLKRFCRWSGVAVVLLVVLGAYGFFFARRALLVENPPQPVDAIVLLGGGLEDRPRLAAALFKSGLAPMIIVTGWGDCLQCKQYLMDRGVPESVIEVDCEARNTHENARNAVHWLRTHRARRAMLVTTWYHSRRALAAFQFYGPEISFTSVPTYHHLSRRSVPTVYAIPYVFREYCKIAWYLVRYGVTPVVSGATADPYLSS